MWFNIPKAAIRQYKAGVDVDEEVKAIMGKIRRRRMKRFEHSWAAGLAVVLIWGGMVLSIMWVAAR